MSQSGVGGKNISTTEWQLLKTASTVSVHACPYKGNPAAADRRNGIEVFLGHLLTVTTEREQS